MPGVWLVSLQVINWLCTAAEDQLRRHVTVADNLRAASEQLADFSEFRATAEVSQSSQRAFTARQLNQLQPVNLASRDQ